MIHYTIDGPEGAPVLVLSNSLGTTLELWEPQLPELARRRRVLRYDPRGHGRSPAPGGPYTADDLGRDVLELLDRLELQRVSFCGLSMGGVVGMWLGANAPERIDRLVLACTAARFAPRERWEERIATVRREGMAPVADASMERWFSSRFREERPEIVARFREMVAASSPEGYAACCEAIRDFDFRARLGEIAAPTLVIAGEEDPATPVENLQFIAEGIAEARLHVIPGVAHLANVEQPEVFSRAVLDHLGEEAA